MIDLTKHLRACADDPMWTYRAEVPKVLCSKTCEKPLADYYDRLLNEVRRTRAGLLSNPIIPGVSPDPSP